MLIVSDSGEENNVDYELEVVEGVYFAPKDDQLQNIDKIFRSTLYKNITTNSA